MKRKLSDLKENDVIKITSKKDCRKIQKLINKGNITWFLGRKVEGESSIENYFKDGVIYLFDINSGMCYENTESEIKSKHNVIHASDLIKPKKSKLKKVWQEIARLDGRIADLEADKTKPDLVLGLECEAEIIQEQLIDWSVSGQIVQAEYTTAITTGNHENYIFEGFVIKTTDGSKVNHLCNTLIKECFNLSKEETIIKNE